MESLCAIIIEDTVERCWISIKIDLILGQRVRVDKVEDVLVSLGLGQHAQPGEGPPLEDSPHHLMSDPAHVDDDLGVPDLVLSDGDGVRPRLDLKIVLRTDLRLLRWQRVKVKTLGIFLLVLEYVIGFLTCVESLA